MKNSKEESARKRAIDLKEYYSHLITFIIINLMLFIINIIFTPSFLWFLFPLLGWGIGLLAHTISIVIPSFFPESWVDDKTKSLLDKSENKISNFSKTIKLFLIIFLVLFFMVLIISIILTIYQTIQPGETIEEKISVEKVTSVSLDGIGKLYISKDYEDLTIKGGERIIKNIETNYEEGNLSIKYNNKLFFWTMFTFPKVEYYLGIDELKKINISGAGEIIIEDDYEGKDLEITVDGAGKITLNEIDYNNLVVEVNGAGNIEIEGMVNNAEIYIDGAGKMEGKDLICMDADLKVDGAGKISLSVVSNLKANIDGAGKIDYWGIPEVDEKIEGLGKIERKGSIDEDIEIPDSACGIENCHGMQINCSTSPAENCTEEYQIGDKCRKYAKCEMQEGKCVFVNSAEFNSCVMCVNQCIDLYNDPLNQFTCEANCE